MIKFGTDGWRARISDEFTFENVRLVAQGYVNYLIKEGTADKGLVVGYDNRFQSEDFAYESAKVAAANGIKVYLTERAVPSPVTSFAVKKRGAAGAIMITASHNPPEWNGFKIKAPYACSASPEITKAVEKEVQALLTRSEKPITGSAAEQLIEKIDPKKEYFDHIAKFVDMDRIKKASINIVIDPMHGSAAGYLREILGMNGIMSNEINDTRDPLFGGINPEPLPLNLEELSSCVREKSLEKMGLTVGIALDGDGDRIGAMDDKGVYVSSHNIFMILLKHLVENKKLSGSVVKTFNVTNLVGSLAGKYKLTLHETPIGFKYIADYILKEDVLIGGEESGGIGIKGHIPERDGVLNGLLLLEAVATLKKGLREILNDIMDEFGYFYYDRIDVRLTEEQRQKVKEKLGSFKPDKFIGEKVGDIQDLDGIKIFLEDNSWILFRLSGTEPLLRIYSEATSTEKVKRMLAEGERVISK